ncbi:A24 family peptidase [Lachnospiraceae bacterium 38-10]
MTLLSIAAAWFDVKKSIIPNALLFPGMGIGVILRTAADIYDGNCSDIFVMAAEVIVLFVFLWPFYGMGGLGAGDCKLLLMAGVFLPVNQAIFVIASAFFIAAIEIIFLKLIRKMRKKIPFAPAFLLAVLLGWL